MIKPIGGVGFGGNEVSFVANIDQTDHFRFEINLEGECGTLNEIECNRGLCGCS